MKKGRIIRFAIIGLITVIFLLAILSFIPFEPPGLAQLIENNAGRSLHRDVSIGKLRVNLLGKISIKDIVIRSQGADTHYPFIKVDKAFVSINLIELLFHKITVTKFEL